VEAITIYQETLVKKMLFSFLLAALLLSACSGATQAPVRATATPIPPRPTPNSTELGISDPAKTIEVAAGKDFTITVKTNLSSDFHWEIAEALDSKIVEYVWKDHVSDDPNNTNSSGKDVWRFKAVAPGKTAITLGYYQGMSDQASQKPVFNVVVQ